MSRRLIIMRHAKSDWGSGAVTDFDRPLNGRGERDARRMGRWLRDKDFIPERMVSSPAIRARGTAKLVAKALGVDAATIEWDRRIYEAEVGALLAVLDAHHRDERVQLMVGHNPGLERLVLHLARAETLPGHDKTLPTAAVYVLEFALDEELQAGQGVCIAHMRPRWLE